MKLGYACALVIAALPASAAWKFAPAIPVTHAHGAKIFHHLKSAGRKNIAVSGKTVAVIWEDNRSGVPQVYVAFKANNAAAFSGEQHLSRGEAYEPAIVGVSGQRFAYIWQEGDAVHLQAGDVHGVVGAPLTLSTRGQQATLASIDGRTLYAAWSATQHGRQSIQWTRVTVDKQGRLEAQSARTLAATDAGDQLYPALAVSAQGHVTVVWEDRRAGHTRLWSSYARAGKAFGAAKPLNEIVRRSTAFGRGNGVARPTLTAYGKRGIAAVWLDKRNYQSGYDVYASVSPAGDDRFSANELVVDGFGENIAQWHAASAGNKNGSLVALWDDDRDDSADVFISEYNGKAWSDNQAVAVAAGVGDQTSPTAVFDADGNLHIAWINQDQDGATEIRYSRAPAQHP